VRSYLWVLAFPIFLAMVAVLTQRYIRSKPFAMNNKVLSCNESAQSTQLFTLGSKFFEECSAG
jgi:hypothetical protein